MAITKIEEVDAAIEAVVSQVKGLMDDYKKSVDDLIAKADIEGLKQLIADNQGKADDEVKKAFAEIEKLKVEKNKDLGLIKAKSLL